MKCSEKHIFEINQNNVYIFLSFCKRRNIVIKNLNISKKKTENNVARFEVDEENFERAIKLLKNKKIEYRIIKSKGLGVIYKYIKKHWFFNIIILLSLFGIYFSSMFIWNVDVVGANYVDKNEILLVLGKGHENYQIINGIRYHFNDKEEVLKCIKT